uniref:Uncharacterized protein n=1 Tax=Anguilla anguilla TaxID=7936 RepID=A0A0E9PKA1_ANGAN
MSILWAMIISRLCLV